MSIHTSHVRLLIFSTMFIGNCAACHTRAETGDFRERYIRLPE